MRQFLLQFLFIALFLFLILFFWKRGSLLESFQPGFDSFQVSNVIVRKGGPGVFKKTITFPRPFKKTPLVFIEVYQYPNTLLHSVQKRLFQTTLESITPEKCVVKIMRTDSPGGELGDPILLSYIAMESS